MKALPMRLIAILILLGSVVPIEVHATNGYFLIGYGAKSRSMGGVGVAYSDDALAAAGNPALMSDVKLNTMRVDFGAELFNPPRAAVHNSAVLESGFPGSSGPVNHESGSNEFLIPSFGAIYKFNRKITMGMAVIGNGANTRYDQTVPGNPTCHDGDTSGGVASTFYNFNCLGSVTAGVQLLQMQMLPSVAYKVNKNHAVGASLAIGVQMFRAYGLQAFDALGFAASSGNLTNEGNDWSYGAGIRLGWLGKFFKKKLSIGVTYASRVYMTEFDKYTNLFAEQGDFDIPEHYAIGFALRPNKKVTIAFDVQQILYSDIASTGNPGPDAANPDDFFPPGSDVLGSDNGLGFGWEDATAYKLGVDYRYNKKWSFRAGVNYGESIIGSEDVLFNMIAPATNEWHYTIGTSYRPSRNIEWTVNFMHSPENVLKGPTVFGPTADPVVGENASISMQLNALGISFGYSL